MIKKAPQSWITDTSGMNIGGRTKQFLYSQEIALVASPRLLLPGLHPNYREWGQGEWVKRRFDPEIDTNFLK